MFRKPMYALALVTILDLAIRVSGSQKDPELETFRLTRQQVIEKTMRPYDGHDIPTLLHVNRSTLDRKVMCGYQGWFTCPGDGAGKGWAHWGNRGKFDHYHCTIDFWPDMREYDDDERYATVFRHSDGTTAFVYSAMNAKSVARHFKWMRDYGIDGVFVQRFAADTFDGKNLNHVNTVLANCRAAANQYGRVYALMYDLSGLKQGQMPQVIEDWKLLIDRMRLTRDANDRSYLYHKGMPVVGVWGIGFSDDRKYTLDECAQLVSLLKNDHKYGGCTVVLGLPTFWRMLDKDCLSSRKVHEIIEVADIVSPWTVGRFGKPEDVPMFARSIWAADLEWCKRHGKEYLPVVWPGFSWYNTDPRTRILNRIPRLRGEFLWKQYVEAKKVGVTMLYQAMFDEVDEGTAIFKCTNDPPVSVGRVKFVTYEGLPSDHYLWIAGLGRQVLRGEVEISEELPRRK